MTGSKKVIALLNELLAGELVAINTYILHSEMLDNWGFKKAAGLFKKNAIDEMKHAEKYIERILLLEGKVKFDLGSIEGPDHIRDLIMVSWELETVTLTAMNNHIQVCRSEGDNVTAELLEDIIEDENRHAQFLEEQLNVIDRVGEQNYLTTLV